jgi:hypothetical protein
MPQGLVRFSVVNTTVFRTRPPVLIQGEDPSEPWLGMVSDRSVLSYLAQHAQRVRSLQSYFDNPLNRLALPSLNLFTSIISTAADSTTLEAMKLMNDEGVSSIAVVEEVNGTLLSAISVTDIGRVRRHQSSQRFTVLMRIKDCCSLSE